MKKKKRFYDSDGNYDWNAYSDRLGKELKQGCLPAIISAGILLIVFWLYVKFK